MDDTQFTTYSGENKGRRAGYKLWHKEEIIFDSGLMYNDSDHATLAAKRRLGNLEIRGSRFSRNRKGEYSSKCQRLIDNDDKHKTRVGHIFDKIEVALGGTVSAAD